ncbi:MAG: hypothetical protein RL702_2927 [Pseudomonadota bacterium]
MGVYHAGAVAPPQPLPAGEGLLRQRKCASLQSMYQTPEGRPIYRLLTGKDDRAFCERVSETLEQGWRLYGSPVISWDHEGGCMKAAQAVVWHEADVVK